MQKGTNHKEETRNKMSEAKSGQNHPMYGVKGEEHPNWGKTHTEETKAKIGKTNSKAVRGIKLIKGNVVEKTSYDQIISKLNDGWTFKGKHIMINDGNYQRVVPTYRYDEFFPNKGWFFGSLEKK